MSDDAPPSAPEPGPLPPASPARSPHGLLDAAARHDRRLFASLNEGVWERDLTTHEVWYSPRYKEMLGFEEHELPNDMDAMRGRVHPDDVPVVQAIYRKATEGLCSAEGEVRIQHQDGGWRWFRGRARVWPDRDGRPSVLVGSLYNVHDEVVATEALRAQAALLEQRVKERTQGLEAALGLAEAQRLAAERASQAKASFLAHMSHELRTPLNGMLGMNMLARPLAADPEQRRYLDLAHQSGQSLLRILDDVLDFVHAGSGQLELRSERFDISDLIADTLRHFMPEMRKKGLQIGFDYIGDITRVIGDAGRVRQIVALLLGNAIKFTEQGNVLVVVEVVADEPGPACRLRLNVRDSGIGMDDAAMERVFDPFEQADSGASRRHGGVGLGLPMVRLLAEMMGGSVAVHSRVGHGSTFGVELRLGAEATQPLPALAAAKPVRLHAWLLGRTAASGKHIRKRLERLGWSSELLPDVDTASQELERRGPAAAPDCVLVGETAITPATDFARLCRQLPPQVAVNLLMGPEFDLEMVRSITGHLPVKVVIAPLTPADLYALQSVAADPEPAGAAGAPADTAPAAGPGLRRQVLVVEDNAMNQIIAHEMVAALGLEPAVVGSGEEALAHCRDTAPDLVLMDIQMPGMDGFETTRRLRALQAAGELRAFPIVALSAHAMAVDRQASLAAGMDEHLSKPIQLDRLRTVLNHWLADAARASSASQA